MAKKRKQNKFGHTFVCEWLGKEWFRDDQGKITSDDGKYAGDAFNKLINEQYPVVAPVELEKVKKKRGRPPKVSVETAKPKPEPEDEEDKPGRTKRILRAMYPDLFETGEKLREIWTGEKKKGSKDKGKDDKSSSKGGRLFQAMFPEVTGTASKLKGIWTGDKEEEQKTGSEKKRQDVEKRLDMERIKDSLNDNGDYLRDLISVQQRSANLLSQIADNIKNLGTGKKDETDLPDKKKFNAKDLLSSPKSNIGRALPLLSMLSDINNLTKEDIESKLNAAEKPAPDDTMNQPMTKVISDWWSGGKKQATPENKPVAVPPPSGGPTDAEMREQAVKASGNRLAGRKTNTPSVIPETKPIDSPKTDIATSKETSAIAEAKQKQVKAEDILTFKGDEIKFNADRLTFEVQSLTIENKGQQQQQAPTGVDEGSSGGSGGEKKPDAASGAGGGTGSGASGAAGTGDTTPQTKKIEQPQYDAMGNVTVPGAVSEGKPSTTPAGEAQKTPSVEGGGTTLKSGSFDQQAPSVMSKLQEDFGLTKEQAAGIVGNLGHESAGLKAGIQEKGVTRGRGGLGWAQWTGPRRVAFEKYLADNKLEATDPAANYGFLKKELETTHKSSLEAVKKETTASGSMMVFEKKYEAAGIKHYKSRQEYTNKALAAAAKAEEQQKIEEQKPKVMPTAAAPAPTAVKEARPEMTAEDKIALAGGELPDAMKLPGGDEGMKDRDVRSANMISASNVAEKEYKEADAAKIDASESAGYETSFDVGAGSQGLQPVAESIPQPPRRPADLTSPPESENKPAPPSPKAQNAASSEQRQRSVESHSPMPGGNGAQFLESVFRIMPYLLHQKKHAPQVGRRWHY